MTISDIDISVVVQGPVLHNDKLTANCLKSIRKHLPSAEIILSTWKGSDVGGLLYNVLVESDDPGSFVSKNGQQNNVNRQLVSTKQGLGKATRPYAIKMRTDSILEGSGFVDYFLEEDHCKKDSYRYFKQKIVAITLFARNPLKSGGSYLFHMSDTFLFGRREDLIDLFDIAPPSEAIEKDYYFPEQYIWTAFLRKKGIQIALQPNEMSRVKFAMSELSLVDNFSLIEPELANVLMPPRFYENDRQSVYTQTEWGFLNDKYCLSSLHRIYRRTFPLVRLIEARLTRTRSRLKRSWVKLPFKCSIRRLTAKYHDKVIADAERALKSKENYEVEEAYAASHDLLVQRGHVLKIQIEQKFKDMYSDKNVERILLHVPDPIFSPAPYSLLTSLGESLNYIGIPAHILHWNDNIGEAIDKFNPSVLLTSDLTGDLERIDWQAIMKFREAKQLKIGLATNGKHHSLPLRDQLTWATRHTIDFYYSFFDETYVNQHVYYKAYLNAGFKILFIPFGANTLHYYPVAGFDRDIDFVVFASKQWEHVIFMKDIVKRYYGFIEGPHWRHAPSLQSNRDMDRYIYARAKVGLNAQLPEQAFEANESIYQLAACGVPQITNRPKLHDKHFSKDAMFIADTPKQYSEYFETIINEPVIGQERALIAQNEVFDKHTSFHRADSFMQQLKALC